MAFIGWHSQDSSVALHPGKMRTGCPEEAHWRWVYR